MRTLLNILLDYDPGQLRIIAELWGLDPPRGDAREAATHLARAMLDPELLHEIVESLPQDAREALDELLQSGGRQPYADMARRHGPLREMGPARRDRAKPWRQPTSPLEPLWYRGLIARAFGETPTGPQEFLFIPRDILHLLAPPPPGQPQPPGKAASAPPIVQCAGAHLLEDAVTLLARLRSHGSAPLDQLRPFLFLPAAMPMLQTLLPEMGLLLPHKAVPDPERVKDFLNLSLERATLQLAEAWLQSNQWNDLAHTPGLRSPGEWPNDPRLGRQQVVSLLRRLPSDTWWDLGSFVQGIKEQNPAFQRPAGSFDTWYLQDASSGAFLRGMESWDQVEGAMLYFLIQGPLFWLGLVDLGYKQAHEQAIAFRLTPRFGRLVEAQGPAGGQQDGPAEAPFIVRPDGRITAPIPSSRPLRYQIARFTYWVGRDSRGFHFRLTPSSLQRGSQQGLSLDHIRRILQQAARRALPPRLESCLRRWREAGRLARLDRLTVLRVADAEILQAIQRDRAAGRLLLEILGPTSAIIRPADWERLANACARLGILLDPPEED
jgi:hypothetical protein